MKKLFLSIFVIVLFSIWNIASARICTFEYAPVCSVEWKTYSNACSAWDKEIAYKWECRENFMGEEKIKLYNAVKNRIDPKFKIQIDNVLIKFSKKIKFLNKEKQVKILETVIWKIEKINEKNNRLTKSLQKKYYILKYLQFELEIILNEVK